MKFDFLFDQNVASKGEVEVLNAMNREARANDILTDEAYNDPLEEFRQTMNLYADYRDNFNPYHISPFEVLEVRVREFCNTKHI